MIESIFCFVFQMLVSLVVWLVLIPIGYILTAPIIFFIVLFRYEGTFWDNVWDEYRYLWKFWKNIGILMVPPW
jgi:hypothetical protein